MPVCDGWGCCRLFREWEATERPGSHQTLVGMSAHATNKDIDRSMEMGMDDFMSKPIHIDELRNVVTLHCRAILDTQSTRSLSNISMSGNPLSPTTDFEHQCLIIGPRVSIGQLATLVDECGWNAVIEESREGGMDMLMSRTWDAVIVDNAPSGVEYVQDFREWEKQHRVCLQGNMFLFSSGLPSSLLLRDVQSPTPSSLPQGVDGAVRKPAVAHEIDDVLRSAQAASFGENIITRC